MRFPEKSVIITIIAALLLLPFAENVQGMAVPSKAAQTGIQNEETPSGGGYYYYDTQDRLLLFLETALYIGLAVGALIILDKHADGLTIIVYD